MKVEQGRYRWNMSPKEFWGKSKHTERKIGGTSEGWLIDRWMEVKKVKYGDVQYRGEKSGCEAETVWKQRRDKDGLHIGPLGSAREHNWVVGLQILIWDCDVLSQ